MLFTIALRVAQAGLHAIFDVLDRLEAYRGIGADLTTYRAQQQRERAALARIETYRTGSTKP